MTHYKNRKPKRIKGCCSMCACRDHVAGLRNKRLPPHRDLTKPQAVSE